MQAVGPEVIHGRFADDGEHVTLLVISTEAAALAAEGARAALNVVTRDGCPSHPALTALYVPNAFRHWMTAAARNRAHNGAVDSERRRAGRCPRCQSRRGGSAASCATNSRAMPRVPCGYRSLGCRTRRATDLRKQVPSVSPVGASGVRFRFDGPTNPQRAAQGYAWAILAKWMLGWRPVEFGGA